VTDGGKRACSGCANPLGDGEGVELWGSRFCQTCFIGNAAKFHRELRPEDIALLRTIGRELAGYLPPELLEMVLVGFHKRATGGKEPPPAEELARCVGEIQRLAAFSNFGKVLNLLKTWQSTFNEFVEGQEGEIRETIKRLTDFE
jgi:hypothetical protein